MKRKSIFIQIGIVLAIILVANLISNELYFRLDFTEDNQYTFSKATKDVLKDLDGVITITAYFSEDLPPQLLSNRQDFEDQLVEYETLSDGNIVFEFINPNESEETEQEAQKNGISPVMINVTERDQVQQLRAYMGAVLKMEDRTEIIPLIQPGAAMEYAITTAIKKVSIKDKPKVGLIQGNGEVSLRAIPQLMEQLSVLYEVEPFNIRDTSMVPTYYRSLIWINPQDSIDGRTFSMLDRYFDNGGGLFVAYSNVQGDLQNGYLSTVPQIGLKSWLAGKGLNIGDDFVIDAQCETVNVQQRQGFFTVNSRVQFPYFPRLNSFADHSITQGLEAIMFPFTSALTFNEQNSDWSQTPLVYTSENTGIVTSPAYLDIKKRWTNADFVAGVQVVAAALEKGEGKIVVAANGTFCVNGEGQQPQPQSADNINLASNAVDWIADDTGLIDLRTKGITSRPLEQTEDNTKLMLKYGNVFAPIVLILIYAFFRKQRNQRKRQKWMQGNYE